MAIFNSFLYVYQRVGMVNVNISPFLAHKNGHSGVNIDPSKVDPFIV